MVPTPEPALRAATLATAATLAAALALTPALTSAGDAGTTRTADLPTPQKRSEGVTARPGDGWTGRLPRWDAARRAIIGCESSGNPDARNPRSTASGLYQFLDGTWEWVTGLPAPAHAYPEAVQHAAFWRLWDRGAGAAHWNASRTCWAGALAASP